MNKSCEYFLVSNDLYLLSAVSSRLVLCGVAFRFETYLNSVCVVCGRLDILCSLADEYKTNTDIAAKYKITRRIKNNE